MTFILKFYLLSIAFASAAIPVMNWHIKFDWVGASVILFLGAWRLFLSKKLLNKKAFLFLASFLIYLLFNGLFISLSVDFNWSAFNSYFLQYALAVLVFLIISSIKIDSEQLIKILNFWMIVGCFASALAIVQRFTGRIMVDQFLYIPYYEDGAISYKEIDGILASTAWFSEASWFGSFLVVPILCSVYRLKRVAAIGCSEGKYKARIANYFYLSLLAAGLILGYSLTTILSITVGLILIPMVSKGRSSYIFILLFGASAYLLLADSLIYTRLIELIRNLLNFSAGSIDYGTATSFYVRSAAWMSGIELFSSNPLIGIGLGQGGHPFDSALITILAEIGLIGFFLYYFLPIAAICELIKYRRHQRFAGTASLLIVVLISDYFNGLVTHNGFNLQRWLLVSLACGWIFYVKKAIGEMSPAVRIVGTSTDVRAWVSSQGQREGLLPDCGTSAGHEQEHGAAHLPA